MTKILLALALVAFGTFRAAHAQETLSRAKEYYASASYDEALRVLEQLREQAEAPTEAAAYEMLCLLALGRDEQARAAAQQIVRRDPFYRPPAGETSPRVRAFFDDVRRPLMPPIVRDLYTAARAQLDRRELGPAALAFEQVVALIDEIGPDRDPALADLRVLAVGFRDLARVAPPAAEPPAPVASPARPVSTPALPVIYSAENPDVSAPVAIARKMPPWYPASAADRARNYRGQLELTIDETGKVIAITVAQRVHPEYDRVLIPAAAEWRFSPAMRDGVPVRYKLLIDVSLAGRK